ncbi:bifunctional 4-hydroxy-2-oxoglutarate aldolase/2-dehydro-3-deoxy-phosphogluconate aldolase [Candidatus Sumerlaeota bacterium]|nr:bifunctional 4-hydroxy-2-oxoglutarate aldolase/2-dehydro-3-deoxy-phosphogluconate aldolase [Candidatus Sumerlaeota bacterium]
MSQDGVFKVLAEFGVVPVITINSPELAIPLADALIEGGLPIAEITFRTPAAAQVIAKLKRERPSLILGAGTILTLENLRLAKECGVEFGVAPGLNPEIVNEARRLNLPFIPGVFTPSEIEKAISLKAKVLKFFPAEAGGGVATLKALSSPYAHTGIKFMPTGGINMENLGGYLSLNTVLVVGGSWIARKEVISAKKWDEIRSNCQKVCEAVAHIRSRK